MKSSPRILMFFCTAFTWSPDTRAADDVWGLDPGAQRRYSSPNDLFNFDDYEATMASLDTADSKAECEINTLYTPIENHENRIRQALNLHQVPQNLPDRPDEDDLLMQKILAESVRTANLEQAQREVDTAKAEDIRLNEEIGKLTQKVEELLSRKEDVWSVLIPLTNPDPEIEALEDHEEKERRLKVREEEKTRARDTWVELYMLHAAAEEELKKLEVIGDNASAQYLNLSRNLESLK